MHCFLYVIRNIWCGPCKPFFFFCYSTFLSQFKLTINEKYQAKWKQHFTINEFSSVVHSFIISYTHSSIYKWINKKKTCGLFIKNRKISTSIDRNYRHKLQMLHCNKELHFILLLNLIEENAQKKNVIHVCILIIIISFFFLISNPYSYLCSR